MTTKQSKPAWGRIQLEADGYWTLYYRGDSRPVFSEPSLRELKARIREMECGNVRFVAVKYGTWAALTPTGR